VWCSEINRLHLSPAMQPGCLSQRSGTARRTCARKRKEEQRVWFSVKEGQASPIRDQQPPHLGRKKQELCKNRQQDMGEQVHKT